MVVDLTKLLLLAKTVKRIILFLLCHDSNTSVGMNWENTDENALSSTFETG